MLVTISASMHCNRLVFFLALFAWNGHFSTAQPQKRIVPPDRIFRFDSPSPHWPSAYAYQESGSPLNDLGSWQRWRWLARLDFTKSKSRKRCGGAFISRNLLLTAAHCVHRERPDTIKVYAGDGNLFVKEPGEVSATAVEIIVHPDFQSKTAPIYDDYITYDENDIAIVRIDQFLPCTADHTNSSSVTTGTILLPWESLELDETGRHTGSVFPDTKPLEQFYQCTVAGYGKTDFRSGRYPMNLQSARLDLIPQHECNSGGYYPVPIGAGMLCAGDVFGGWRQGACTGDSGSPLMCRANIGRSYKTVWQLVGIVSWGFECASHRKPGVYTDVSVYQKWIESELVKRPHLYELFLQDLQSCHRKVVKVRRRFRQYFSRQFASAFFT